MGVTQSEARSVPLAAVEQGDQRECSPAERERFESAGAIHSAVDNAVHVRSVQKQNAKQEENRDGGRAAMRSHAQQNAETRHDQEDAGHVRADRAARRPRWHRWKSSNVSARTHVLRAEKYHGDSEEGHSKLQEAIHDPGSLHEMLRSSVSGFSFQVSGKTGMKTRRLAYVFVGLLLLVGGPIVCAQVAPSQKGDDRATSAQNMSPEQSPDSQTPSSYSPPPGQYEKAVAYSRAHYRHLMIGSLWGIVVPLLILRRRLAPKYRDWAERVSSRRFLQVLVYAPLLLLTMAVLGFPFEAWDHTLSRSFGLSVQSWPSWLGDWITNQIIAVIVGILLVWILYAVMRRSPRRWWFYFWLAAIPIVVAVFFIAAVGDRSTVFQVHAVAGDAARTG